MAIRVSCTCGEIVETDEGRIGEQLACPACGTALTVRPPSAVAPSPIELQYSLNHQSIFRGFSLSW